MNNLFLTLMIAFVVIVIAIACLAIGWLFTGKTKIDRCGRDPTKRKDDSCSSKPCDLCHPSDNKNEKNETEEKDELSEK